MNQTPQPPEYPPEYPPQEFGERPQPRTVPVKLPSVTPIVTYSLLALTVLVYLGQLATPTSSGVDLLSIYGMKVNTLIAAGQWWRLITPIFLHGSILHIGFNMYALYVIGPGLERFTGHARFFVLYLLAGFAGNVFSMIFTTAPSLGASTAIFGLLAGQGVFLYRNKELFGGIARRALTNIVLIAAINFMIGLSPGIDNWGHLGGLLGGGLFSWLAGPVLSVEGIYPALALHDKRESRDVLLAGIGVGALFIFLAAAVVYLRGG